MKIDDLEANGHHLTNLNNINIILGRNGAGKSRFLRILENTYRDHEEYYVRYISPERAGTFRQDGNVLTNMQSNPTWLSMTRSTNQATNFKAASALLLRQTETMYLRRLQNTPAIREDPERNFVSDRIEKINRLLTNISLELSDPDFIFRTLSTGATVTAEDISSGESEAVSLAAEILYFFDTLKSDKFNMLLLDEPDVHLHPDLQARLGKLIVSMFDEFTEQADSIAVCIATHSAPLVCSLADSDLVSIGTKSFEVYTVDLKLASDQLRKVAPFFGHPLSLSLSQDAPLILEGEDDERVWQQAARTSQGRLKVFPVLATSVDQQTKLEEFSVELLGALYDKPLAFSVRDGDGVEDQPLEHRIPLHRYRLGCYSIENVLVTDSCLAVMASDWRAFTTAAGAWLTNNGEHKDAELMRSLINADDRLRNVKIKDIRQLICAVAGSNKPWEVVVGQAIGAIKATELDPPSMLVSFLGADLVENIILREEN